MFTHAFMETDGMLEMYFLALQKSYIVVVSKAIPSGSPVAGPPPAPVAGPSE